MLKKIKDSVYSFFIRLFWGLKAADDVMFKTDEGGLSGGLTIEQQNEQNSVYKDLLKGEVTQEVVELRHEMYYSERLSHKYKYLGNGIATKKNELFDYNGKIDTSDGFKVQLVQENKEDTGTLTENMSESTIGSKNKREFTINIKHDFIPRFRLEEFTTKIVVKRINETAVMLDFYTPIYEKQFMKRHRAFISELERIYLGDIRSDIITINSVDFMTFNAYGSDDYKTYVYNNIEFDNMLKFDGNYILRFTADIVEDGSDMLDEFYSKEAEEKSNNHVARNEKGITADFATILAKQNDTYDYDEASNLLNEINE